MRDHYYQLFDLEKNFGEKRFCGLDGSPEVNRNPYKTLSQALGVRTAERGIFDKSKGIVIAMKLLTLLLHVSLHVWYYIILLL